VDKSLPGGQQMECLLQVAAMLKSREETVITVAMSLLLQGPEALMAISYLEMALDGI
jgi:hypothetical protein